MQFMSFHCQRFLLRSPELNFELSFGRILVTKPGNELSSDEINIQPGVGMYALFKAMTYKPWVALGELVDNSIDSYTKNRVSLEKIEPGFKLKVEISFDQGEKARILVEDNAAGIAADRVQNAFTPASSNPDHSGIGRFGIGMKSATGWYSNYYTISSRAIGEEVKRTVIFDIPKIIKDQSDRIHIATEPKIAQDHGTRIVMTQLHRSVPQTQTLTKLRAYLASMYREFIRNGTVEIFVGGEKLTYDVPDLLFEPYWPNDKGPSLESKPREWKKSFSFELSDSWAADDAEDRPSRPPVIEGWIGILAKGDNQKSGLALIWKGKVIYGAGSMAESGSEEIYRPYEIFRTRSSNQFLRIIGEIDVSELNVTAFKDRVNWRQGEEDEFLSRLLGVVHAGKEPLLGMATNYRTTQRGSSINKKVEDALNSAAESVKEELAKTDAPLISSEEKLREGLASEPSGSPVSPPMSKMLSLDDQNLVLEVIDAPFEPSLIRVRQQSEGWSISFNRAHPFVNSFASLPDSDLDPVLRMAIAIGLAEIRARNAGTPQSSYYRQEINELLRGSLSSRIETPS